MRNEATRGERRQTVVPAPPLPPPAATLSSGSSSPHVLVVGGGPAGSVAATILARLRWAVTLVEQQRFPRDKVCGECLSALGLSVLARHDLLDALRPFGPAVLTRVVVHAPDGASMQTALPEPMWGIARGPMDDALLGQARAAGVAVCQPARCEAIEPGAAPAVRVRDLADHRVERLTPRLVILADGRAALLPRRPTPTRDLGIKAHFVSIDAPRDAIELFGVRGHYGGLAPVEGGRWNAAFSVPAARVAASRGDLDAMFEAIVAENAALRRRMRGATRAGHWLASPLPRFAVDSDWPENVIPIGNAAAALEPVGGEGMGLAVRSAELAAAAIDAALRRESPLDVAGLRRSFNNLWRVRRSACRAIAIGMSRPWFAEAAVPAAAACEGWSAMVAAWMGKSSRAS